MKIFQGFFANLIFLIYWYRFLVSCDKVNMTTVP